MYRLLVCCIILVGCNTPTLDFAGAPAVRVQVGKSTFDVRRVEDRAQAIRINTEWAPNWRHTYLRFAQAFEAATGCTVRPKMMQGDQALMEARLNCPFDTKANPWDEREQITCTYNRSIDGYDCERRGSVAVPGGP